MVTGTEPVIKPSGERTNSFPYSGSFIRAGDDFNTPDCVADPASRSDFCFNKLNCTVSFRDHICCKYFVIIFSVREGKQVRSVAIAQLALSGVLDFVRHVS